jgi:hypothetical protein
VEAGSGDRTKACRRSCLGYGCGMKAAFFLACFLLADTTFAQDFSGEPGSEQWKSLYEPAYSKPTELPREGPLRKQLFDLLRPKIQKEAGQAGIRFQGELKAFKNWAFFFGTVLDAKDRTILFQPVESSESAALWLRTKEGWKLIDYAVGLSDPFYWQWADQYGVPRALLGVQ